MELLLSTPITPGALVSGVTEFLRTKGPGAQLRSDYIHPARWNNGRWNLYADNEEIPIPEAEIVILSAIVVPDVSVIGTIGQGPVSAMTVLRSIMPWYIVDSQSESSDSRTYTCRFHPWNDLGDVMPYLEDKLGDVLLQEDPRELSGLNAYTTSEAMANSVYLAGVCHPADTVVNYSRPVAQAVQTNIRERGEQRKGVPDFRTTHAVAMCCPGKKILLAGGEGKGVCDFQGETQVTPGVNNNIRQCAVQEASYMNNHTLTYGWVTNQHSTMFLKRIGQHDYAITKAIPWDSREPTVLAMMAYVLMRELECDPKPWPTPFEAPENNQQQTGVAAGQQHQQQQQQAAAAAADMLTGSQYGQQQQSAEGVRRTIGVWDCSSSTVVQYLVHPSAALVLSDEVLGYGRVGQVTRGSLYGRPCVVKIIDAGKQSELLPLLQNEIGIYHGPLRNLQNQGVLELIDYGFIDDGNSFFLALSEVHSASQPSSNMPTAAADTAEQVLDKIHATGILHGDVSASNVLMQEVAGCWKAWFIDFGLSREATSEDEYKEEVAQLRALFKMND